MMDLIFRVRGDQIGSFDRLNSRNNPQGPITRDAEALGSATDWYTIEVSDVANGASEFENGQFITIFAPDGSVVAADLPVDTISNNGFLAGDEHLILFDTNGSDDNFIIDLGGVPETETDVRYGPDDENAVVGVSDDDGELDFAAFPCLAIGTLIRTPHGQVPIETLKPGQTLTAEDGSECAVLWVGQRHLTLAQPESDQRPVCFEAGSLGAGMPERRLVVSQGHRMFLAGSMVQQMFEESKVLAAARGLLDLPGVRLMRGKTEITYVTVLLDRHAVIEADGAFTESFYPGPYGMRQLGREMRREVAAAIPGFDQRGLSAYGLPAHRLLRSQESRQLVNAYLRDLKARPTSDRWDKLSGRLSVLAE